MNASPGIIVVGTSAGGVTALSSLLSGIPKDINVAIFIVQHTSPDGPGLLPAILQRVTPLHVAYALEQAPIQRGHVYIAPSNRHLVLVENKVITTSGPRENYARPAIDPLFRSAALVYGPRVMGVILTGTLDDGTAGLWAVKERGGVAIVQDPKDAQYSQMPHNAATHVRIDHCLPVTQIGPLLGRLAAAARPAAGEPAMAKDLELETRIAKEEHVSKRDMLKLGDPSVFTCPECQGALLQINRSGILRFRCHTGHAFSVQTLLAELNAEIENNLWTAIRSMEECVLLLDHVAGHLPKSTTDERLANYLIKSARVTERQAAVVRQVVMQHEPVIIEKGMDSSEAADLPAASEKV